MKGYIYQIVNNKTGERYIGQTIELVRRLNKHKQQLRDNKHNNPKLQSAWNKYGEENFTFDYEEYELDNSNELNQLEIDAIKKYDSYNNGYNLTLGGDGGNTRGKLSFDDYCFIYLGCQWNSMTDKIAKFLNIDSSTVSHILRDKSYLWFKQQALELPQKEKDNYIERFRKAFGIANDKPFDEERVRNHLSEEDYFYCLCIASTYGRGIESALGRFYGKHKSFLSNGIKGKTKGNAYLALQRFRKLTKEEVEKIGQEKFEEWNIQDYSSSQISFGWNDKWRN